MILIDIDNDVILLINDNWRNIIINDIIMILVMILLMILVMSNDIEIIINSND